MLRLDDIERIIVRNFANTKSRISILLNPSHHQSHHLTINTVQRKLSLSYTLVSSLESS
jgi:hypothetical protein